MASLTDLLLYKREVEITNPMTLKPIKKVWVRILGDFDLNRAYKQARVASATKRAVLRDPESDDYKDEVLGIVDLPQEDLIDLIKTARTSNFIAEAQSAVERPELPELEEIAVDPDAAKLEDLENLDKVEVTVEKTYQNKMQEYVDTKLIELSSTLASMSSEEILNLAQAEVSNIVPFSIFIEELNNYKAFYGTFQDKLCKIREFETIEEFKNLPKAIKDQIGSAISQLEVTGEDVKN
jgi:hypothetical protein